jgi:O-antigen ligase
MSPGRRRGSIPVVAAAGRWLLLCGVLLMVTGDGPASAIRMVKWPTPFPFLAWSWLYLSLFGLALICIVAGRGVPSWTPTRLRFLVAPLSFLLVALLLSTIFSRVPSLSIEAFLLVLGIVGFCWIVAAALEDEGLAAALWPVVAMAILFLAFRVVVWRRDEGLDVTAYQVMNNAWLGKLQLAWVLNVFAPLLLARFLGEKRWALAVLYALTWAESGLAVYLLFSRMGLAVFGMTTAAMCLLHRAAVRRWLIIGLVGVGIAVGGGIAVRGVGMFRQAIATLVQPDRNPGVEQRFAYWRDALVLFRGSAIVGTGLGTFDEVVYSVPGNSADGGHRLNGWHAHNVYLHVLAETGVLGLSAWCLLWWVILAHLARAWRRADNDGRIQLSGALLAVIAFLVLSISEVLIGARVHASLRMNLTIGLVVVMALHAARPRSQVQTQDSKLKTQDSRERPETEDAETVEM